MKHLLRLALFVVLALMCSACSSTSKASDSSEDTGSDTSSLAPTVITEDEDTASDDWDAGTGEAWDAFHTAYSEGWATGCTKTIELGGGDALYYNDEAVDAIDCSNAESDPVDEPTSIPTDPQGEGEELGELEACMAVFGELSSGGSLFYGEQSFDSTDCPASPGAAIVPAATAPKVTTDAVVDCPDFDMSGVVGGPGAGFYNVSVRNLDCATARKSLALQAGDLEGVMGTPTGTLACSKLGTDGETASYRCASGSQAVRFNFGS